MTGIWRVRAAILTLIGALGVHQARFLLAPPEHEHELAGVHHYLTWLMPLAAALLFVAVVQLGVWIHRAGRAGEASTEAAELPSGLGLWVAGTASLITVFAAQETIELAVVHDRLPELPVLLQHLGWQLIPLAIAVSGLLALLLKGAAEVVRAVLRRRTSPRSLRVRGVVPRAPALARRGSLIARNLAGRAPPSLS